MSNYFQSPVLTGQQLAHDAYRTMANVLADREKTHLTMAARMFEKATDPSLPMEARNRYMMEYMNYVSPYRNVRWRKVGDKWVKEMGNTSIATRNTNETGYKQSYGGIIPETEKKEFNWWDVYPKNNDSSNANKDLRLLNGEPIPPVNTGDILEERMRDADFSGMKNNNSSPPPQQNTGSPNYWDAIDSMARNGGIFPLSNLLAFPQDVKSAMFGPFKKWFVMYSEPDSNGLLGLPGTPRPINNSSENPPPPPPPPQQSYSNPSGVPGLIEKNKENPSSPWYFFQPGWWKKINIIR